MPRSRELAPRAAAKGKDGISLGFWFAQQGSIYVFVLLIFFYTWRMNRLDRRFDVHED